MFKQKKSAQFCHFQKQKVGVKRKKKTSPAGKKPAAKRAKVEKPSTEIPDEEDEDEEEVESPEDNSDQDEVRVNLSFIFRRMVEGH